MDERKKEILMLLYAQGNSEKINEPIEGSIKLMKELFLLEKEFGMNIFGFIAYDLGPCSFQVYVDIDSLKEEGFVNESSNKGKKHKTYSLSQHGINITEKLFEDLDNDVKSKILKIKKEFNSMNTHNLIVYVYKNYPEFTARSKYII